MVEVTEPGGNDADGLADPCRTGPDIRKQIFMNPPPRPHVDHSPPAVIDHWCLYLSMARAGATRHPDLDLYWAGPLGGNSHAVFYGHLVPRT